MAPNNLTIDAATPADLPDILRLYEAAGIVGADAFTVPQAEKQLVKMAQYPFFRVFVAKMGARTVGTYEFILIDNLAKAGRQTALVEDVAVAPDAQRMGIGRAMMAHARDLARSRGAYKMALSSNTKRTEAHAFYESLGFERHGVSFLVEP